MRPVGVKGWVKNKGKFSGRRRTKSDVADNESSAHDQGTSNGLLVDATCCIAFGRYPCNTSPLYRGTFQEYTIFSAKANSAVFIGKGQKNK